MGEVPKSLSLHTRGLGTGQGTGPCRPLFYLVLELNPRPYTQTQTLYPRPYTQTQTLYPRPYTQTQALYPRPYTQTQTLYPRPYT